VSFCTHARNVLEFFWRRDRTDYNYALATDYADASYVPVERRRGPTSTGSTGSSASR
jgi:hypothetical protein